MAGAQSGRAGLIRAMQIAAQGCQFGNEGWVVVRFCHSFVRHTFAVITMRDNAV